ncbi:MULTISPECIES: hypothetical protein [Microbacterium]|uniref:hypothetical protein n=1 Tax=Microbacterium TaxID=33882 RepID=UPI00249DF038|nr:MULTISPECIES: hypothetical protein [Microbacterium]WHE36193.1 hypothetical protein P6897_00245 [Microbacterium sp. BDGP8]WRK17474.1 hypothetical protein VC184_00230 [Microbacterium plantarum]
MAAAESHHDAQTPAINGYPDARPIRDGLRILGWTLRGFTHGAERRKSTKRARRFSALMFVACIIGAPALALMYPAMIALRRHTRYYMTPERDATLAITAKRDAWHVAGHTTAQPGSQRGRALRRGIAPLLTPALDQAGKALVAVAVSEGRAQDYSADVPGLVPQGQAWPRGVKMRREPRALSRNRYESTPTPKKPSWLSRNYGRLVAIGVVVYLVVALYAVINFPRQLLNNWLPDLDDLERSKLLGSAGNLVLLSIGGVAAVIGVGISLSRHHQEREAAQRDLDRLNDDRAREQSRREEVDAQWRVETERTLRERFVTTVQLLSDRSPVNRQAALFALGSLADDWHAFEKPDEVQVCIEVLAGYLRAPRSDDMLLPPDDELDPDDSPTPEERRRAQCTTPQEVAVKQAGYTVIRNHLYDGSESGWHNRTINLAGAHIDFTVDLSGAVILPHGSVSFASAHIGRGGLLRFVRLHVLDGGRVFFDDATVQDQGVLTFSGSVIRHGGALSFRKLAVQYDGQVLLARADVAGVIRLDQARIGYRGSAKLTLVKIQKAGLISFSHTRVENHGTVDVSHAQISGGRANLSIARISRLSDVILRDVEISGDGVIELPGAAITVHGGLELDGAVVGDGPVILPSGESLVLPTGTP